MKFFLLLLVFAVVKVVFTEEDPPIVQTHLGGIKGSKKTSYNGRTFAAYEGIPYAVPPLLQGRFQVIRLNFIIACLYIFMNHNSFLIILNQILKLAS